MAQYIPVYMDDEEKHYKNKGLYDIIAFIGERSYDGRAKLSCKDAYKRGKKIINSKLKKWNLNAIEKLVFADRRKYAFNYDQKRIKPVWKIHRVKAKKIFIIIRSILREYKDDDIIKLFDKICKDHGFLTGTDAAGAPYYDVIKEKALLVVQNYDEADIKALEKCAKRIEKFSKYHRS